MKIMRRALFLSISLFFSLFTLSAKAPAPGSNALGNPAQKKILYLSSSDSRSIDAQKMFNAFTEAVPEYYNVYYQFLDYQTKFKTADLDVFDNWYSRFIKDSELDAIICADPLSLEFVMQKRASLFKDIPVIAQGIVRTPHIDGLVRDTKTFVIDDLPYIDENIKLINSLFPRRRKIVFIGNDEHQTHLIDGIDKKFDIDASFKDITGMDDDQLLDFVQNLERCSIIYMPSAAELNLNVLNAEKALELITSNSENPVFVCHDVNFGRGILGGYFTSKERLAEKTANALRSLEVYGTVADVYEKKESYDANYYFDAQQMKKYNITKNSLNIKTVYINDGQSLGDSRSGFVTMLIISVMLLAGVTIVLIIFTNQRHEMQEQIKEERIKLNIVISQSDSLFWECVFDRDENEIFLDDDDEQDENPLTGDIAQGWIDSGIIPEEYLDRYNEMIDELKAGKETVSIDLPLLQEDIHTHLTNTRWKHIVYQIVEKKNGKVTKAMATAMDITNRKRAEEEYEGGMSYRAFVNKEYPAYTRLNLTSNVVMERMINIAEFNHSMNDSTADNELENLVQIATMYGQNPSLGAALTRKELLTAFMNGTHTKDWDFFYEFSSGIMRWYSLSVEMTSNPYTNCIEANIYLRDITNRKIMSISKDSVLDEEVEYIFWLDLSTSKCHFIHASNSANWIDHDGDDDVDYYAMTENLMNNFVSSKDKTAVENFFALKYLTVKLKDKQAANCTFEVITDNLRIAIKQVRSYYLNGNSNIIVFICRDITDITLFEKLQNEKLTKAIEQAEKANASKSDFLSRMSHDLRTPMNGVIGIAELAEDEVNNPDAILKDLRKIKASSTYMVSLLNDILDMAKIESGKLEIRKGKASVGEIIDFICMQAASLCEKNQINFYCNLDAAKYMDYFVNVDRMHLQQIVMNLLSNSSKFTPPQGRIELLITQTGRRDNISDIEIVESDTGSGMTAEFQRIMFEAFTQDVNSVNKQGTGLGLSIVNSLVQLMGGTIRCDSAPGEGTKFTINLSIEILDEGKRGDAAPAAKKEEKTIIDLTGKRILLVEDNALNQEISRRILQKKGMDVTIAENGLVALNTYSESELHHFDLVLMDVMMPVMGGIESAHLLRSLDREDAKTVPIVALTANAFQDDIQACLEAGMNTHLSKPINPLLLIQTISDLLSQSQPA